MIFPLKEFKSFVSEVDAELMDTDSITSFDANIRSNKNKISAKEKIYALIEDAVGDGANVYVIWSRKSKSEKWIAKYIGQRSVNDIRGRLKEHLWSKSDSTYSKLEKVKSEWDKNNDIGISTVLIEPDSLRLSVEAQLIYMNTKEEGDLLWNKHERQ